MNRFAQLPLIAALSISGAAFGQAGDMKGMNMKQGCMDMKEMKGMDMSACKDMMKEKASDRRAQAMPKKRGDSQNVGRSQGAGSGQWQGDACT